MRHRPATIRTPAAIRACAACLLAGLLAACGGRQAPTTTATAGTDMPGSAQQVEASVGDVTVYMTAIQTSAIPAEVAREHGIERRDDLVMLRISPRQGSDGQATSAPVQVEATVSTLGAAPKPLALRQVVANGLVDHVGTIDVQLPETVTFQATVATPGGARETLRLTRDFGARQ